MAWTLTVGQTDLTTYVLANASFTEIASSASGDGLFTVNGAHADLVPGAAVTLQSNGVTIWEGTVLTAFGQKDESGNQIATLVRAQSLGAAVAVGIAGGSYQNNDVAVLAAQVCAATPIPWGGPGALGVSVGSLSFSQGDDALTVLATLADRTWGVREGEVRFVSAQDGLTAVSTPFDGAANTVSAINLLGGADAATRVPLATQIGTIGNPAGPVVYVAQAEIADAGTLNILARVLADRYGKGAICGSMSLAGMTLRAGDWLVDPNGVTAIAYQTRYELLSGQMQLTVSYGFPALSTSPQYSAAFADAMHRTPAVRLHADAVISGLDLSITGLTATISAGSVLLDGAVYPLSSASLLLPKSGTVLVTAGNGAIGFAQGLIAPQPGTGVALYRIVTLNGVVLQQLDVRTHGGIGNNNLKPPTPAMPSVTLTSLSLVAEGATAAKATIAFTIAGVTFDDSIGSIEIVQSIAGENQWGNAHVLQWSPTADAYTDYRHALQAGQSYDLAVHILGRNGQPLTADPILIGAASPTISSAAIAIALNLDQVADGATYHRMPGANMDPNRRALIDFTQGAHIGKILDNISDGPTYGRPLLVRLSSGKPLIDFSETIHLNKILDNIGDGATYGRPLLTRLSAGKPWIDFSEAIHANKQLDYIGDGSTYGRPLLARLSSGKPWIDFSEAIHANKNLDNIADGATYVSLPLANIAGTGTSKRALIDFTQAHANKVLDNIGDGATYGRPLLARLSSGKPWIDFSETIHANKNVDNIGDGSTYGRPLLTRLSSGKPLIDFAESIHLNKTIDNVGDGTTYARPLAAYLKSGRPYTYQGAWSSSKVYNPGDEISSGGNYYLCIAASTNNVPPNATYWQLLGPASLDNVTDGSTYGRPLISRLSSGKPWIDFSESIHANKNVDNLADGSNYGRPLLTRLSSGKPLIDFSESIHLNKNLDNIADGATYAALPLANISGTGTAKRALIDFTQSHANKNLDNISDGATYASIPLANISGTGVSKRALIDFTQAHANKTLDNVGDGSTYARIKSASLTSNDFDFAKGGVNKVLDNIADGATYARIKGSHIVGGVAYNYKGVWSSATAYVQGDEVIYGPSYWIALAGSTNSAPATNNANWQVVGTYSGYQGAWNSATAYIAGAEVTYNGNYWVCITANTNSAPTTSNANWQIAGPSSLDNIADGASRFAVAQVDANKKAIIDFNSAHLNQGALSKKNSVDLATTDVLNKVASNITYTGGATVDSLKPAQAGADVTSQNTAADTSKVNGVAASTVQDGSNRANNALNSGADSYGSWVKSGQIHRGVLQLSGDPSPTNLIYNPTGTAGYSGWTRMNNFGAVGNWTTDAYSGGRFLLTPSTFANNDYDGWYQTIPVTADANMVISALLSAVNTASGVNIVAQVYGVQSATTLASLEIDGPQNMYRVFDSLLFNTGSNTQVQVKIFAINMSGSSQSVAGEWYSLQLEYGAYPTQFVDHTATKYASNLAVATLQRNLVLNGNNSNGTGSVAPGAFGWTGAYGGGVMQNTFGQLSIGGKVYYTMRVSTTGAAQGAYQLIPVIPGQTYTYCLIVYADPNCGARIWIGDPSFNTQFNPSITMPLGSLGTMYSGLPAYNSTVTQASGAYEVLYGTFEVPSGFNQAAVLIENISASAGSIYFGAVQVIQGNRLQDYIDHEPNSSYLASSSPLNQQGSLGIVGGVPSSLPYSSTSSSITLNLPAVTLTRADRSTISVPALSPQFTGLGASQTCYVLVGINAVTGMWQASLSNAGAYSGTQQITMGYAGDGYIPIFTNAQCATAASGQTGGGTGGTGGGYNGGSSCPAVWQEVETLERGLIRADEVEIGEHLLGPNGPVRVLDAIKMPAPIWRYTLDRNGVRESFDVNDAHALKTTDGEWLMVKDLRGGEQIDGENGPHSVVESAYLKDDCYIAFTVVGHVFLMGGATCHNATTL